MHAPFDPQDEAPVRIPISVKFEIPYFTVSGIQVRYLKIVEKSGYQALPWVRVRRLWAAAATILLTQRFLLSGRSSKYITQNGDDYSLRTLSDSKQSSIIAPL